MIDPKWNGITYAIDPGKWGCGVAWGIQYGLHHAKYMQPPYPQPWKRADCADQRVVLELMRIYPGGHQRPNDLIDVQAQGGILAGRIGGQVILVPPRDWKGTINGDIMVERIKKKLTPAEMTGVTLPEAEKTLAHNVWDAIGIYLWAVGRLG